MREEACQGTGSGWGTIDGSRVPVFVYTGAGDEPRAAALCRALTPRHTPELFVAQGLFASLKGASRAQRMVPALVHGVGITTAAKAAVLAAGLKVPLVLSLERGELTSEPSSGRAAVEQAAAVLLDSGECADLLRARGVQRELYVLALPDAAADDPRFIGALEVVYGRVLGGEQAHEDGEPRPELVQIGRR